MNKVKAVVFLKFVLTIVYFLAVLTLILTIVYFSVKNHQETEFQRSVVNDVKQTLDTCKIMGDSSSIAIKGKALVWDMRWKSRSNIYDSLPSELKAKSSDKPITVFMITDLRWDKVGTYSVSHELGYRQYIDVAVAYWPDKKAVGMHSIVGKEPRSQRPIEQKFEVGDLTEPVVHWIESLPLAK